MADLFIKGAGQLTEANKRLESGDAKGAAELARETWTANANLLSTNWAQPYELLGVALSWVAVGQSEIDVAGWIDPTIGITSLQTDRPAALDLMAKRLAAAVQSQRDIELGGGLSCAPAHT